MILYERVFGGFLDEFRNSLISVCLFRFPQFKLESDSARPEDVDDRLVVPLRTGPDDFAEDLLPEGCGIPVIEGIVFRRYSEHFELFLFRRYTMVVCISPTQIHRTRNRDVPANQPDHRGPRGVVFESELLAPEDIDAGVLENNRPLVRVIHTIAGIRGIVLIPRAGRRSGEVYDRILSDIKCTVGTIGTRNNDRGIDRRDSSQQTQGGGENRTLHEMWC